MKRSVTALILAAALVVSLTACTTRDDNAGMAGGSGNNSAGSNVNGAVSDPAGSNVNGTAGDPYGSGAGSEVAKGPAGSAYSNGRMNYSRQSSVGQRTGNPYLADGRYQADEHGDVGVPADQNSRSLTDAARDLVRGTEDALRDVGNGMKDAARDVTGR